MLVLPKPWLEKFKGQDIFESLFALEGKVFRSQQGRKTILFELDGKSYFAKLHRGVGWKEIAKNLVQFRLPVLGAETEWQGIMCLKKLGIRTTPLVGYGKRGWNPARLESFIITERLYDTESLEDFCRDWRLSKPGYSLKKAIITEVAKIVRTIHEHGMCHKDLYICHFLIDVSAGKENIDPRSIKLFLIDLHRMSMSRRLSFRSRTKDVAALYFSSMDLGLTTRDLFRFMRAYKDAPVKSALKENAFFWWCVRRRGMKLYHKFQRKYQPKP